MNSNDGTVRRLKPAGIRVQDFLGNLPMFSEMSREELDRIAACTLPSYVAKGEAVFHAGDPCTGFHIVVYGQVKLGFNSPQGGEKVVEIIGPGQSFGEALMFLEKPYIVFAHALHDTMLLRDEDAPAEVELSAGKSVVASRLNMTPEHFSRVLHELSAAGLIQVDGRTARILDADGLRAY